MKALSVVLFLVVAMGVGMVGCTDNAEPLVAPDNQAVTQSSQVTNTLAKKPLPNLRGTIALVFTPIPPYFWNGTLTIDGETYGLRFKSIGEGPPPPPRAFVFEERFEIWDDVGFAADLLLEGPNHGVVSNANSTFRANGKVELANGDFVDWLGRNIYESGIITWQTLPGRIVIPAGATGTFRIN